MTNQAQSPYSPPPRFYWYTQTSHVGQRSASKDGNQRVNDEFVHKVDVGVRALTRREPDPEKRKAAYRRKPVELWVGQRVYFPHNPPSACFEHDWADWERIDPDEDAVLLRAAIMQQVEMQSADLERQLLLDEAQARAGPPEPPAPPPEASGPEGVSNVQPPPPGALPAT